MSEENLAEENLVEVEFIAEHEYGGALRPVGSKVKVADHFVPRLVEELKVAKPAGGASEGGERGERGREPT
jgi:hypothetical protein